MLNDERQYPVKGPHHSRSGNLKKKKWKDNLGYIDIERGVIRENKLPKASRFDLHDSREPPSNPCARAMNIKRKEKRK